ncbi:MAG TPA: hypothetical protein V6C85_33890 [Allocoleopsis sp.]
METQRLEIAENVSLVGSVLGTVAAVALKQVGFAAAPLTLALALSLVNRRRFQQQTQEYTASAIAQTNHALQSLHQQIQTVPAITTHLEDLHQQFNARPETIAISQLTKNLDELTRRVERLPSTADIDTTGFEQAIADIYTQLETLTQRFDNSLTSSQVDLSEIVQAIDDINGQVDTLTSRFDYLPAAKEVDLGEVDRSIAYINSQLETLTSRFDSLPATTETDLSEVEQAIAYINSQLETLTSRFDSLPAAKEADVNEIEPVIAYINSQLETLHQEFNSRLETQAIEQSQSAIAQLTQQLEELTGRFDGLSTPAEVNLANFEQALGELQAQLDDLSQQFTARPETIAIAQLTQQITELRQSLEHLPAPTGGNLAGFEQMLTELGTGLDSLNQQFSTRPEVESIAQLTQKLEDLTGRLDNLSTPAEVNLSSFEVFESALVELGTGLENLTQQFNTRPEAEAIAQLTQQLEDLTGQLDRGPASAAVDLSEFEQVLAELQGQLYALNQQVNSRPEAPALEQSQAAIAQLTQQLDDVTARLDNLSAPAPVDFSEFEQVLAELQGQLYALNQQVNSRPESQALEQTQAAIAQLTQQLEDVTARLDRLPASAGADFASIEPVLTEFRGQLDAVTQRFEQLPTPQTVDLAGIEQAIAHFQGQLDAVTQRIEQLPAPQTVDLTGIEQSQVELRARLEGLNQEFNTRSETQAIAQLAQQLNGLTQHIEHLPAPTEVDLTSVEQSLSEFRSQLDALTQRFEQLPTPQPVDLTGIEQSLTQLRERLEGLNQEFNTRSETQAIAQLAQQLNGLTQHVEHLPAPTEVDLTRVEQSLSEFRGQLDALTQRFEQLPAPQPVDLTGIEQSLAQLREQLEGLNQEFNTRPEAQAIAQLAQQLNDLTQRIEQLPAPTEVDLTSVEQAIAQLREQLDTVTQRLDRLPTPQEVDLSGVEQTSADIRRQLDSLVQQFNTRPETQTLEQLEQALSHLTQQQETLKLRFDCLPTAKTVDLSGIEQGLEDTRTQLESLHELFNTRPEPRAIEQMEGAMVQLAEQIDVISQRLDHLPTVQPADFSNVDQALADFSTQLSGVTLTPEPAPRAFESKSALAEMTVQPDTVAARPDKAAAPSKINLPSEDGELSEVEEQLIALYKQFNERPETKAVKQAAQVLPPLKQQLNTITMRLGDLATVPDVDFDKIEQAVTDSHTHLETLTQQFNARPETQAIEQIETGIAQVADVIRSEGEDAGADAYFQLSAMEICLENLPPALDLNLNPVEKAIADIEAMLDTAKPEAQTVKAIETAIVQLQERLSATVSHLESLPVPDELDLFG